MDRDLAAGIGSIARLASVPEYGLVDISPVDAGKLEHTPGNGNAQVDGRRIPESTEELPDRRTSGFEDCYAGRQRLTEHL